MRHGTTGRRHRHRGNNNGGQRGGNGNRMQVFDSNGPDVRTRGTAHQVFEKYLTLAKDAASAGDRVLAESYLQHAEHYQRIINSWEEDVRGTQNRFQHNRPSVPYEARGNASPGNGAEDLSLPASILGAAPQPETKENSVERTGEVAVV